MSMLPVSAVMKQLAQALPAECRSQLIVVGSLAAAYHFLANGEISTKDVDAMVSPNAVAVRNGKIIAERLFEAGWRLQHDDKWGRPGTASTPDNELPILRLDPPDSSEWFLELASAPPKGNKDAKRFQRVSTQWGDFTLYSFRFLALAEEEPLLSEFGLPYARPEMMALANLLHHPRIGRETIGETSEGFGKGPRTCLALDSRRSRSARKLVSALASRVRTPIP